jgi:hypothetical protein
VRIKIERRPRPAPTKHSWLGTYVGMNGIFVIGLGVVSIYASHVLTGLVGFLLGAVMLAYSYREEKRRAR